MKVKIQNKNEWIIPKKLDKSEIEHGMAVVVKFKNNYYYGFVQGKDRVKVVTNTYLLFAIDEVELFRYSKA